MYENADYYAVFDVETNNMVAEFESIRELRAFLKRRTEAGENIAEVYYVDASKLYAGALIWTLASEPSKEY